ncbi:heavy metal translocating P-type ATPase [Pseudomonas mangiferae]|uniref:P-type Zn(2+) transporter n=1 Tax=Pseudomonas mangiferae TaxID=2593654 RepID=A0A553GUZ5_9PSED|nr:heavy metal translocating P-type ATPase [Pseudomonas mangiferae]TRX73275.1 heavy metal translocating P-type ATPase [Pseudomonas mangiferae]
MDCPTEQTLIQNGLGRMRGVERLDFNLLQRTLGIWHALPDTAPLVQAVADLGMTAEPLDEKGQSRIRIAQMDCPTEERLIRTALAKVPGVNGLEFNLLQRTLLIQHEPEALEAALEEIRALGFDPQPQEETTNAESTVASPERKPSWPLVLGAMAALAAELVHFTGAAPAWVTAALALLAILSNGLGVYRKGWIALKNRNLNINALMSIAVTGAVLIGQWPEAAMVMVLFNLAERIEALSLDRARRAIRGLLELTPERATVLQGDGAWEEMDVSRVAVDSQVRVRPGERIGLDGVVTEGQSTVDQAPITGESLPVEKAPGDTLFAGTINQSGALEYRVTATASGSTLARIIHAVEEAQGTRAPTQRFVDRFSRIYTPAVFLLALAVALLPPLLFAQDWSDWLYRALVLLVVACPCALVISTPVTIVSGLAAAARKGILIKGGVYLESGRHLNCLALDKTGTLTHGKPVLTDVIPLKEGQDEALARVLAASLARRSDHPVSRAVAKADDGEARPVEDFAALPGQGVRGRMEGKRYHLGNHRLVEALGFCSPRIEADLERLERQGRTVVVLCDEEAALALFAVADTLKESSRQAIVALHELGIETVMLTGDNAHTAAAIAAEAGIDQARGDLLPDDKRSAVEALQAEGRHVGMVGDGINDAPALARAQVGFAMAAAGTDTAIETADVALMDDDLRKIPQFVRLSRRTARVLRQNIALALGIKAVFLAVTLAGDATMWMAVFADMGVSLLVVFNGLRLLRA